MDQILTALLRANIVKPRSGYYETNYGNTAIYIVGNKSAYDVDAGCRIPLTLLDKYMRPLGKRS